VERLFILTMLCSWLTMLTGFGQDVQGDIESTVTNCIHAPQSIAILPFLVANHYTSRARKKLKPGVKEKLERSLGEYVRLRMAEQLNVMGQNSSPPYYVLDRYSSDKTQFDIYDQSPDALELTPVECGKILNADAVITGTFFTHELSNEVNLLPQFIEAILFNWWVDLSPGKDDPTVVGNMKVTMTCVKDGAILWELTKDADTRLRHKQLIRNAVRNSLKEFPKK
jgi:hypothetical protein